MKTIKKYLKQTFKELFRNYFYKYFIIGAALSIGITVTSLVAYSISATFDSGNVLTSGDLKQLKDAITKNSPPVGSIIALHKDMTGGTPPLETPLGDWVECNGQILSDASSPYNGQKIPNLNGVPSGYDDSIAGVTGDYQMFLRGGTTTGTGQMDAFQGHWHTTTASVVGNNGLDNPDGSGN